MLNLATCVENKPYTAACFYVFDNTLQAFVFTSDKQTQHGQQMLQNSSVAASIALETHMVGKIQGLQITGKVVLLAGHDLAQANKSYLLKYPFAVLKETTLWALVPEFMKLTDNRLGFGKKLIWEKSKD